MSDETYAFDEVYHIELQEGLPKTKNALMQVEYVLASVRVRGGHLIKFIHDEQPGKTATRLRAEVRRLLRAYIKEGRVRLVIPGERFAMADGTTRYLIDKCPRVGLDPDLDMRNEDITVVYC